MLRISAALPAVCNPQAFHFQIFAW
jgi:hypothetical protein